MINRLALALVALLLSACGGGGDGGGSPVTISNLRYSPAAANATLGSVSVSGGVDFSSGADLSSLRITDSQGNDTTVPVNAPGLRSGRVTIPAANIRGSPVGIYAFTIWLKDVAGTESNKLQGQIEIRRVPPQAKAGPDLLTYLNSPLLLDGSASTNVNGTATTYNWRISSAQPSAGIIALSSLTTVTTNFSCSAVGIFDVELRISDGVGQSAPDPLAVSCIPTSAFTLGSAETDVSRLAGTPTAVSNHGSYYVWGYSDSLTRVQFSTTTRKVIGWWSYNIQLPTTMPFRESASGSTRIAIGSTKNDVARIQGTPREVKSPVFSFYDEWAYDQSGLTYIRFSETTGLVTEYRNYDGSLRI